MKLEIVFKDGRKGTFDSVASFNVTEEENTSVVTQIPTEGKPFEVNPLGIDRSKFERPLSDRNQELTRKIIQDAFAEVDKNPEKYTAPFYTLIPEKKWDGYKTVAELKAYANDLGGLMADWVEQALEWAQRISNGESWEAICNNADTANWYRMIVWKYGYARIVGGSCYGNNYRPASYVDSDGYGCDIIVYKTVPLVVLKKK